MVIVGMMVRAFQALEQSAFVGFVGRFCRPAFFGLGPVLRPSATCCIFQSRAGFMPHDDCFSVILILLEELTKYQPV